MTSSAPLSSRIRFGAFDLKADSGELRKSGTPIKLRVQAVEVLLLLTERAGHVVTREEIRERLWSKDTFVDFERSINFCINQIRAALGDDAEKPRYVETLPRRGYRFIAPVTVEVSGAPAPIVTIVPPTGASARPTTPIAPVPREQRRERWSWQKATLASVFLVLALGASGYFLRQRAEFRTKVLDRKIMLAVLPFENLGGDPEQEYFSDGLTEEMIARLGNLNSPRLAVIARSSAMHYKHTGLGVAQIGRELGVDYLLQGTVRRELGVVRVTAELVQVRDQTHVWSRTYQHDESNLPALQNLLAQDVAAEIQVKLTPAQQERLASARAINPEAHEAYLRGLYFWNKLTEQGMAEAITYFQQAIHLDPSYAEAYARLGSCYGMLGNLNAVPPNESYPRNKAAALKALEIDDTVSDGHAQLAYTAVFYDHDWPRAEKEFRRAIELNPSNANAHNGLAQYFMSTARFDDSLAEVERARELDPVSLSINFDKGWFLHFARKPDEAIAQLQRTLELDPNSGVIHFGLGNAYELKGDYEQAITEYQTAIAISGQVSNRVGSLGHAYGMAGRKNEAREILERLKLSRRGYVSPYHIGLIYVALGEKDEAFAWLKKASDDHYWLTAFLKVDPRLDSLRSDVRYQDLLHSIGLDR
jgi:TolB-like protein/DNA-binding winged helix-turn-helix (wHTH) protein/Tfp pilus assembly protein PilF